MKKSDRERRTDASTCKMMPEEFNPSPYEVLIGRGRRCTTHWGNLRFRKMVADELAAYTEAQDCKRQKSVIIGRVLADIQHHSPHAGFVKKDVASGRWLSLTDAASRVTIAQAFRDALVGTYRSSRHSKQVKRRIEKRDRVPTKRSSKIETEAHTIPDTHKEQEDELDLHVAAIPSEVEADSGFNDSFAFAASIVMDVVSDDEESSHGETQRRGSNDFDALFDAFDHCDINMEDNPFEPLPLVSAVSQEIDPLPLFPTLDVVKHNGGRPSNQTSFGSTVPFRDVRSAMCA